MTAFLLDAPFADIAMQEGAVTHRGATLAWWHRRGAGRRWIVLLHGAGIDHRVFAHQVAAFAPDDDLVFCDLRAHGRSTLAEPGRVAFGDLLDDLGVVLDALRIDRCTLVGHSYGGNVAQEFAFRHPERVEALVMIGSPGQHRVRSWRERLGTLVFAPVYLAMPWRRFAAYSARWCSTVPETQRYVEACLRALPRRVYLDLGRSGFAQVHRVSSYPRPIPTLLIRGERDMPAMLDAIWDELLATNPLARRAVIPGTGHQCLQDEPEATNAVLVGFMGSLR